MYIYTLYCPFEGRTTGAYWKGRARCERQRGNGNIEKVLRVFSAVVECFGAVLYLKSVYRA